jgi:gamma-glutamylcyclotransferase (GGCT)/AIG2-like uncharacterized protein YtfP
MNTNVSEMAYRCPNAVCIGTAKIKNHKLVFRTHADIEAAEDNEILGVIWKISPECEFNLDILEGFPHYYDKKEFIAVLDKPMLDMSHLVVMAYQMTNHVGYEPPSEAYKQCLVDGYNVHGVDVDQIYRALEQSYV